MLAVAFLTVFSSCKKDDDTTVDPGNTGNWEDGWYITGDATPFTEPDVKGLFAQGLNENDKNNPTAGLFSMYMAIKGGKTFTISQVIGGKLTKFGAGADLAKINPNGKYDQIKADVFWGTYAEGKTFQVEADGLYQISFDINSKKIAIAQITHWGVIGGSVPTGWSGNVEMPLTGAFNQNSMTFKATDVIFNKGEYKFRFSDGWKLGITDSIAAAVIKVNTNFGGTITNLVPGGANMTIADADVAIYTVEMTWTLGAGMSAKLTKTGPYTPPSFPSKMYLIGDAVGGWDFAKNGIEMVKCAGGTPMEGVYWRVVYLEAGKGFKVSAFDWKTPNCGGPANIAINTDIELKDNVGENMTVAENGYYNLVVDLRNSKIMLSVSEVNIYGIGDPFGGYTAAVEANKFVVDNTSKKISLTKNLTAGNLRVYVAHKWIKDWWNSEFNIYSEKIEYRADGGDQAAVPVTAGNHTITFDFSNGSASIQ